MLFQIHNQSVQVIINQKSMIIAILFITAYFAIKIYRIVATKLKNHRLIDLDSDCIIFKDKILHFEPREIGLIKILVNNPQGAEVYELLLSICENSVYESFSIEELIITLDKLNHMIRAFIDLKKDVIFREKPSFDNGIQRYKIRSNLFKRSTTNLSSYKIIQKAHISRLSDSN